MKSDAQRDGTTDGRFPENLISDLRKLGFTEYEARTYVTLLEDFPATAYEIGKNGGLVRANVYNAVDALEKMGAVQPVSENPVRYVPIDPKIVLDVISRRTSSLCADVADRLTTMVPEQKQDYVWNLAGADNIHRKIGEIIADAREHIWIKANETHLARHLESLHAASRRGVKLLFIAFGPPGISERLSMGSNAVVYPHEGSGVIVGLAQTLVTVTSDFRIALTANLTDNAHGAFTQNQSIVNLAESLIRHEVYLAEIFAEHEDWITARFGPYLRDLRAKYLPKEQVQALKETIRSKTVDVTGDVEREPPGKRKRRSGSGVTVRR